MKYASFLLLLVFSGAMTAEAATGPPSPWLWTAPNHESSQSSSLAVPWAAKPEKSSASPSAQPVLDYDALVAAIKARQVQSAELHPASGRALITLNDGSRRRSSYEPGTKLADRLEQAGAKVVIINDTGRRGPPLWIIGLIGLLALAVFALISLARRQGPASGQHSVGALRRTSEVVEGERPQILFADVGGCAEAVEEVSEFLDFLRQPARFHRLGAKMPKGLLLYGAPGTGKTLLAKALAGEAGVPFFAVSGSEFVEKYVGVGASRIRELFRRARASASGAVIFIDEIDAVGKHRSADGGGNEERNQTLNQLLVEMDGFSSTERIVVIGATNRLDTLDPALLRPGRFSRQVLVDLPNEQGRLEILELHARGKLLADDVDLYDIAAGSAGASGADLAEMLNEGAIWAARRKHRQISQADLQEGQLRVIAGAKKHSPRLSQQELEVVAHHEAGHVLVAELSPTQDKMQRATIEERGRAGGLAMPARSDRSLYSIPFIHQQLMVLLGGRAAEQVIYGQVSSGAANDLQQATLIARRAVEQFGFSPRSGQIVAAGDLSDATRRVSDEETERMIAEAYADAIELLNSERSALEQLAQALLRGKDLDRLEIVHAIGQTSHQPVSRPANHFGPRTESVLAQTIVHQPKSRRRGRRPGQGLRWLIGRQWRKNRPRQPSSEV